MKSDIDWKSLESALNPPVDRSLDFNSVRDQFTKLAFDVYKRTGEEGLWELREAEDGRKVLVALYDEEGSEVVKTASASDWSAHADSSKKFVTLAFRGSPVYKFAAADHGFAESEAANFANFVATRARDPHFFNQIVSSLTPARRAHLLNLVGEQGKTND